MSEARIVVNGTELTESQAITIRLALITFQTELSERDAFGSDRHGHALSAAHQRNVRDLFTLFDH
jgi:hypothetical protein